MLVFTIFSVLLVMSSSFHLCFKVFCHIILSMPFFQSSVDRMNSYKASNAVASVDASRKDEVQGVILAGLTSVLCVFFSVLKLLFQ